MHIRATREREGNHHKIREEKWDVVVLQEQSLMPVVGRERMFKYGQSLHKVIREQGAETVFYLTWARQHVPKMQAGAAVASSPGYSKSMFSLIGGSSKDETDLWCKRNITGLEGGLNGSYLGLAKQLDARVAPVGIAWSSALKADPQRLLHKTDKSHPNQSGTYLAACVFYATLLGESPVGLPASIRKGDKVLANVEPSQARQLQQIAWRTVQEHGK